MVDEEGNADLILNEVHTAMQKQQPAGMFVPLQQQVRPSPFIFFVHELPVSRSFVSQHTRSRRGEGLLVTYFFFR